MVPLVYNCSAGAQQTDETNEREGMKRYLLCPAGLSILTLKKFIARKYGLPTTYRVDIMYLEDILNEDYTLMDVAYIYAWRRVCPQLIHCFFRNISLLWSLFEWFAYCLRSLTMNRMEQLFRFGIE